MFAPLPYILKNIACENKGDGEYKEIVLLKDS